MTTKTVKERLLETGGDIKLNATVTATKQGRFAKLSKWWTGPAYQPLNAAKRQIRLIRLLPRSKDAGPGEDVLRAVIKVSSVPAEVPVHVNNHEGALPPITLETSYDALSYCWGSADNPQIIEVNGEPIPITRNLHQALSTLRDSKDVQGRWLWIDALSINQDDLPERNAQVPLMKDIFGHAENTHIWLGPETDRIPELFLRLDDMYDGRGPDRLREGKSKLQPYSDEFFEAMEDFMSRAWWHRVWVVQESVLAKNPIVHCGSATIEYIKVIKAINSLYGATVVDAHPQLNVSMQRHPQVWKAIFDAWSVFHETQKETIQMLIDDDIVDQIGRLNYCDATNPRDCVYGLLGLLPLKAAALIVPDYAASIESVYENFTVKLVQFTRSLGMLRLCGRRRSDLSLPSWVPDYRSLTHRGYWAHKAAYGTWHGLEQKRAGELEVLALCLDSVLATAPTPPKLRVFEMLDGDDSSRLHILVQSWRSERKEIPYFNMLREETRPSRKQLARFVEQEPLKLAEAGDQEAAAAVREKFDFWATESVAAMSAGAAIDERLSALKVEEDEAFFVTAQGRIGLAYVKPQPEDIIAILAGSSYPVVLRPAAGREQPAFEVVSPVYCDGMMRNEALQEASNTRSVPLNHYAMGDAAIADLRGLFEPIILV